MLRQLFSDPVQLLIMLPAVLFSLTFHEFAHALTAVKLGDSTPAVTGRLSLNPLAHLDLLGFLCMLLTGFGWAKPVKVNPRNFKNYKGGMAITALAGPVSNILLSFVSVFILVLLAKFNLYSVYGVTGKLTGLSFGYALLMVINTIIYYMSYLNLYLAIFNLIPVPPLDGSRLVSYLLPGKVAYYYDRYGQYFQIGLFVLLMIIIYLGVFNPISWVAMKIWNGFWDLWLMIFGL